MVGAQPVNGPCGAMALGAAVTVTELVAAGTTAGDCINIGGAMCACGG